MQKIAKHYVRSFTEWKILIVDPNVILIKIFYPRNTILESAQIKKWGNSIFERD